jgi:hypothetical protein
MNIIDLQEHAMNTKEIVVTVGGLLATYLMPWPVESAAGEDGARQRFAVVQVGRSRPAPGLQPDVILERARTGPLPSTQPTR